MKKNGATKLANESLSLAWLLNLGMDFASLGSNVAFKKKEKVNTFLFTEQLDIPAR